MTKAILIDPNEMRRAGALSVPAVPLNQYSASVADEITRYGAETLVRVYRDMVYIREFENMLDRIKKEGVYEGITYNHNGPAHLSIGQEAAVVGQALALTPEDFIFGSHRSHGEILAKSFSAIEQLGEAELLSIMEGYQGGATWRAVASFSADYQ
jgi:2-oxoisovalerate dehydrogenase E1 component